MPSESTDEKIRQGESRGHMWRVLAISLVIAVVLAAAGYFYLRSTSIQEVSEPPASDAAENPSGQPASDAAVEEKGSTTELEPAPSPAEAAGNQPAPAATGAEPPAAETAPAPATEAAPTTETAPEAPAETAPSQPAPDAAPAQPAPDAAPDTETTAPAN